LACAAAVAQAGGAAPGAVETRQFRPTPFSGGYLRLDGSDTLEAWKLRAAVDVDYAWKPLVLSDMSPSIQRSRKTTYDLVGHAGGADLTLAIGIGGRFEVGAILPLTVLQLGETVSGAATPGLAGVENPRLGGKVRLIGHGSQGFGLGASALVVLPYGLGGAYIHENALGGEGRLFADFRRGRWGLAASGGYRMRGATQLFNVPLGNELLYAAGAEARVGAGTQLFAELAGATAADHPLASVARSPLELLVGARRQVGGSLGGENRFWLTAAAGPGLAAGYGSPVARALIGLAWSNQPAPRAPAPPAPPPPVEKCPGGAGCPKKAPPPPADRDKDGVLDDADECPDEPEDKDGFEDEDGCPDPDNDKDGILDAADKCPNDPETINGFEDDDGCPDQGPPAVRVGPAEIETLRPVFFDTDRARVRHAFHNILGQVALTLKAHPEIGRCAVEGHTDATGPTDWNQRLSVLRAQAVVEFLVGKGVDRQRLTAIGHGEQVPWESNDTESGRAKNRRVIFHIEGANAEEEQKQAHRQRVRAHNAEVKAKATTKPVETPSEDEPVPSAAPQLPEKAPAPAPAPADPTTRATPRTRATPATTRTLTSTAQRSPAPAIENKPDRAPSLRELLKLPKPSGSP
jgi:outer membrane protein OmpA-like peptidoglycan-associated protein